MAIYDYGGSRGANQNYGINNTNIGNNPNWFRSAGSVGHWNYQPQETPVEDVVYPNEPFLYGDLNPYRSETEKFRTRFDPTQIQAAPENKGFNFPSIWGGVRGGLEWLGDKFKRSPEKQAEWDALRNVTDQYGTYRTGTLPGGQYADIVDGKITVTAPDGTTLLRNKNFDSMFGSNSVADMLQKKEDWAKGRFDKFGDEWTDEDHRGISKDLYNYYKSTGAIDKWRGQPSETITEKTITDNIVPGRGQSDRAKIEAYTGRPMSAYRASRPASERQFTGHGKSGMGRDPSDKMASGGRVGLRMGGDPTQWMSEQETITPFQLQQEEGVPLGLTASAVDPMDALNDMSMDIFGKPLNLLNEEEYQMLIDMANDQARMGQGEGLASLV